MPKINQNNIKLVEKSITALPQQIISLLAQAQSWKLPKTHKNINKVVVSGMGGSNLGARIIASVLEANLKLPILVVSSYEVPGYVDKNTLYICSSYSGTTEETISAYHEAKKRKAKLVVIGANNSNNKLAHKAQQDQLPYFLFTVDANPSNQPRLALGYAVFALIMVLRKANVLKLTDNQIKTAIKKLTTWNNQLIPQKSNNSASKLADKLFNKNIVIITGNFLAGNAHTLKTLLTI